MNDLRKDDGGPAFPRATGQDGGWESAPLGMSLRDYFAGKALRTIADLANYRRDYFEAAALGAIANLVEFLPDRIAKDAYLVADAMLKERAQ